MRVQAIMGILMQIKSRDEFSQEAKQNEISVMVLYLSRLQKTLEKSIAGENNLDIPTINTKLSKVMNILFEWSKSNRLYERNDL